MPRVLAAIGLHPDAPDPDAPAARPDRWHESDAVLITYGDSVIADGQVPLATLTRLVADELASTFPVVHVLPFTPSSSDRGFAVVDFDAVDPALGTWADIDRLADEVDLMADLVCNHVSASSAWFRQFLDDLEPGRRFFITADPGLDLTRVVRPRPQRLLQAFTTRRGIEHVWCTFSRDQVDLNWAEPDVLLSMLAVIDRLIDHGTRFLRLDAVAFLWKDPDSPSVHLPETHEIVRLLHTLLSARAPRCVLVTETNVPHAENVSYFGAGDAAGREAHMVYNFTLPPLVVDALVHGRSDRLTSWLDALEPPPPGCCFLNFLASHDGIGLRPAEGLLDPGEIRALVEHCADRGGFSSTYATPSGPRPYELDIALWNLLDGDESLGLARYLCAHAIMAAVAGIPAVYVGALLAVPNDRAGALASGIKRDVNRGRVDATRLGRDLADPTSPPARVVAGLRHLLAARSSHPAFHPEAPQRVPPAPAGVVAIERTSLDGSARVLALHNVTPRPVRFGPPSGLDGTGRVVDLLGGDAASLDPVALELAPYGCAWLAPDPPG